MVSSKFLTDTIKLTVDNSSIFLIRKFFDDETLDKITKEIDKLTQLEESWEKLDSQTTRPRKKFYGYKSEVFKEVIGYLNTEEFLTKFFNLTGYKLSKVDFHLWWDTEGYTLPMHLDNDQVKLSMQIYIGSDFHNYLGTSFGDINQAPIITLPYMKNTGYFLSNPNTVQHGLLSTVPENFNRFSLYFYMQ